MRPVELTPPRLAFVVMTRAAFAAGVALLATQKLPSRTRKVLGAALGAVGLATTIPALRIVRSGRRQTRSAKPVEYAVDDAFMRRLVQLHT